MRSNKKLYILSSVILFVLLSSIIYNVFFIDTVEPTRIKQTEDGQSMVAPFPPSLEHPLGTDRAGNDLVLRLLGGFGITFFLLVGIAILRVILGLAAAYLLVYPLKRAAKWILLFLWPFQVIPAFLITLLLMGNLLFFQQELSAMKLMVYQFFIILLMGLPVVITLLSNEVKDVLRNDYIKCSYSLGASDTRIFMKHVLPVLRPRLLVIGLQQISMTLVLLMHLGIFQIYIGGQMSGSVDMEGNRYLSLFGEWAGMIGESKNEIITAPWIFFGPLTIAVLFLMLIQLMIKEVK